MAQKIFLCGAGFLGPNIATAISQANASGRNNILRRIQLSSRNPDRIHALLHDKIPADHLLPAVAVDITNPKTLVPAFKDASVVVSLVGILHGSPEQFERIQWRGAQNVAQAAKAAGARLVHISAIGADRGSKIPYARTKALGEEAVLALCPDATIIRPSIVFGPGDGFFNRFAKFAQFLPFLPVFGTGSSRFQPVYVGDIGRLVELITRDDPGIRKAADGKIIEAGGPDIFTFRQIMELVLKYTNRWRPIVPVPWAVGMVQGAILERLPPNLFTLTRDQVEQLRYDNVVASPPPTTHVAFDKIMADQGYSLTSVHEILPQYLR
ncbi:NAD-P-binding protein [Artomyces pyxidatus]|uniref:NAD-P-binding protein n=1 Tax=Artomyces pyxidatus TaxID=48021 RepID=A0ACB8TI98_9AGAM|nr:NAD-P-binding protein [Artomyces pyxidatus]